MIGKSKTDRRLPLIAGVAINIFALGYYKTYNLFIDSDFKIIQPLAISFFTFQSISFLVDSYKDKIDISKVTILKFLSYISFFGQLVAGPIVRFTQISSDLDSFKNIQIKAGLQYFVLGLNKKILIADNLHRISHPIFSNNGGDTYTAITGAIVYGFQIYFDFSAYSDMAIGLGKMIGINLPINFNSPYKSKTLKEFWSRWHITLSNFIRDYFYIPLGGNRENAFRNSFNVIFVMFFVGGWHGTGLNYLIWGVYLGVGILLERALKQFLTPPSWFQRIIFFTFIYFSWIIFRSDGLIGLSIYLERLCSYQVLENSMMFNILGGFEVSTILVATTLIYLFPNTQEVINRKQINSIRFNYFIFVITIMEIISSWKVPFIYFHF